MGNLLSAYKMSLLNSSSASRNTLLFAAAGFILCVILRWRKFRSMRPSYPKDMVILHQIERGPYAPSLVPFAVKLETYLRISQIPYQNVHSEEMSPKGKMPWIEYNGEIVADSQFCMEYLNKIFDKDLNKHLSTEEKAIGRAFQKMLEENTYWTLMLFRLYYDVDMRLWSQTGMPRMLVWFAHKYYCRWLKNNAYAHGIGRHSKTEVHSIMVGDLKAVSDYLGNKKYLFGNEPCEIDCAIFGQLSQFYWHAFGNPPETAIKDFYNLCAYCDRMKNNFWPDWDNCITHGSKATTEH